MEWQCVSCDDYGCTELRGNIEVVFCQLTEAVCFPAGSSMDVRLTDSKAGIVS